MFNAAMQCIGQAKILVTFRGNTMSGFNWSRHVLELGIYD